VEAALEASAEAVAAWRSRPGGRGLAGAAWRRRRRRLKRSGGGGGRSTPQPPSPTPSQAAVEAALEAEAEAVAAWRSRPGGRGLAEAAAEAEAVWRRRRPEHSTTPQPYPITRCSNIVRRPLRPPTGRCSSNCWRQYCNGNPPSCQHPVSSHFNLTPVMGKN